MLPVNATTEGALPALSALKAVSLFLLIIWTISANGLVFVVLYQNPKLRTVPNLLVANLAFSDFMLGLLVLPLSATYTVVGSWISGKVVCEFWLSLDVLICTSSIWNLSMVGLDRYWAITKPVDYINKRTVQSAAVMIAAVWGISAAISLAPLAGWKYFSKQGNFFPTPNNNVTYECSHFQDLPSFTIYSATGSFYIPMLLMFYVYYRIYKAFLEHQVRHSYRHTVLRKHLESTILRDLSNVIPDDEPNRVQYDGFVSDTDSDSEEDSDSNDYVENNPSDSASDHDNTCEATPLQRWQDHAITYSHMNKQLIFRSRARGGSFSCQDVTQPIPRSPEEKRNSNIEMRECQKVYEQYTSNLNRSLLSPNSFSAACVPAASSGRALPMGSSRNLLVVTPDSAQIIFSQRTGSQNRQSQAPTPSNSICSNSVSEDRTTLIHQQKDIPLALTHQKTDQPLANATSCVLKSNSQEQVEVHESSRPSTASPAKEQPQLNHAAHETSASGTECNAKVMQGSEDVSAMPVVRKNTQPALDSQLIQPSIRQDRSHSNPQNHVQRSSAIRKDLVFTKSSRSSIVSTEEAPVPNVVVKPPTTRQVAPLTKGASSRNFNEQKKPKGISAAKEKRGVKVLGIILGCFTLCWLPFFIMYFVVAFCKSCQTNIHVEQFITWLGYANSAMNPIIYTVFNRDYQIALRRLLKKQNRLRPG